MKPFQKKQSTATAPKVDSGAGKHFIAKIEEMTDEERIRAADQTRIKGNDLFKDENTKEAMEQYDMAVAYLGDDFMGRLTGEYREKAWAVKNPCHLNMAACLLKLKRYHDVITQCNISVSLEERSPQLFRLAAENQKLVHLSFCPVENEFVLANPEQRQIKFPLVELKYAHLLVLIQDENNVKALYRRGKAKAELGQAAAAQEDLLKACELAPDGDELADELKAQIADMAVEERLRRAEQIKEEGNALYKDGKLGEAVQEYEKAVAYMGNDFMDKLTRKYYTRAMELKIPCHLNMAACLLKLKRYEETISKCNTVLAQDENNVKALFRRGKAGAELGRTEAAREDLSKAHKLAPEDKAIVKELHSLAKDDNKAVYQKQKELYKGIFGPRIESEALSKQNEDTLLETIPFKPKVNLTRRASKGKFSTDSDYW